MVTALYAWLLMPSGGSWVPAFRDTSYSSGHVCELHVLTLEKQLFWEKQKVRLPFLYRNTVWRLQNVGLHSHSCLMTIAKYRVSENAWLTACLTRGKRDQERQCLKIIYPKKIFASNKILNAQTSQFSSQGYSAFFPTSA